jgi:hypothetical protein
MPMAESSAAMVVGISVISSAASTATGICPRHSGQRPGSWQPRSGR